MVYYRLIDPGYWHAKKQRFVSFAFRNSTGGGISVIDRECVIGGGLTPCAHIYEHYVNKPSPAIIWEIESDDLTEHSTEHDDSFGDPCHYNILGIDDPTASTFMHERLNKADFYPIVYCAYPSAAPVQLASAQWEIWLREHQGSFRQ